MGKLFDTLQSFVSGLGTLKDPVRAAQHVLILMDRAQLEAAYRSDWVSRKIVDLPAKDATREWRYWKATQPQIKAIELAEKSLRVRDKARMGLTKARLYGGAAVVMGVNQGRQDQPLEVDRVGQGDLKFVHVCSRYDLSAGRMIDDVNSPWYGEPEYYTRTNGVSASVQIHPSRVVQFVGAELPDRTAAYDGWGGDSALQIVDDAIRAAGLVSGGIAAMVNDAKYDVIHVPEFTKRIGNQEYKDRLSARLTFANVSKGPLNAIVVDKDEEWERIQTTFQALPDLLKMYLLIASGAAHIPATIMLGQSAVGLNATGDNDVRNYYDRVKSEQENDIRPALERLDEVLIRSALGSRPSEITYEWAPLWQLSDAEKAENAKKRAETAKIDADTGLVPLDALQEVRVNQLIEDGTYPGIEEAVLRSEEGLGEVEPPEPGNDNDELDPEEDDPGLTGTADARRGALRGSAVDSFRARLDDARPRTLYLRRDVLNGAEIREWAAAQGFEDLYDASEMHATVAYSRAAIDWMKLGEAWNQDDQGRVTAGPGGPRAVEAVGDEGVVALLFSCTNLQWRHEDVLRAGGSHDYDEYQPHVSFARSSRGAENLDLVVPYRGRIVMGPEIFDEVKSRVEVEAAE